MMKTGKTFIKDNCRGVTLIELAIAMAIIAILAAVSIPNLIKYSHDADLRDASLQIRADLQKARSEAIRIRSNVTVQFTATGYSISMTPVLNATLPSGVTIDLADTTLNGANTTFTSRGIASSSANDTGNIVVERSNGDKRTININRLGRITVQ